jgi:sulfate adenylyltransferase subunit 2
MIVHRNEAGVADDINPFTHGSGDDTDVMKTEALKQRAGDRLRTASTRCSR